MELLYLVNYAIFAVFLCLLIIETGVGILSVIDVARYRDAVKRYILPVWGVDGTFGVFYIINFIATYPGLVIVIEAYVAPILIAALFFLIRSSFIAYSEFIGNLKEEHRFRQIYGVSTVIVSFLIISILSSAISGIGVNASVPSINLLAVLFNPLGIMLFVAIALIALFMSSVYFSVSALGRPSYVFLPAATLIIMAAIYLYVPSMYSSAVKNYYPLIASVILMFVAIALDLMKNRHAKHAALLWIFASIMMFGIVQYPYLLGGSVTYTSYITNTASGAAVDMISLIGGILVTVSLMLFVYINYLRK